MNDSKRPTVWEELFPSRFLKAALLKGQKPSLTIKDIYTEKLPDDKGVEKLKGIVSFVERDMELALNRTNGICIKAMFGKELSNWTGKKITLFQGSWNGEECIRIWGSPDIAKDITVSVALPRRKPFEMVMHAVKSVKPQGKSISDPRTATAWELLGLTVAEGEQDRAQFTGTDAAYIADLNRRIDERNQQEGA